jgi:tripartite-type tricarboxylate transporter receptor subunit TctC
LRGAKVLEIGSGSGVVLAALGALGTALATPAARAQPAWPAGKPIRLVIPSGPGGGADYEASRPVHGE